MDSYIKRFTITFFITLLFFAIINDNDTRGTSRIVSAKKKTYTVTPKTKLNVDTTYYVRTKSGKRKKKTRRKAGYKYYNKYTRNYYVLMDRCKKLEKSKGGTLILKKGTYTITNSVCIPSNVKVILKNGATIKKGKKTGSKKFIASGSLFHLIKPSKLLKKNVYGKYNGMKNITFVGEGNATMDLRYIYSADGIVAGHNKNVTIKNITFKNMNEGHFIELDANYNTKISGCKFMNSKGALVKEAINVDTPDKKTKGWLHTWSKFDKTPNKNVTISNCYFYNLGHAVGTHKYSYGHMHYNIRIVNNRMLKIKQEAIRMMNWKYAYISNNTIQGTGKYAVRGILGKGTYYPTIQNNSISGFNSKLIQNYAIFIRNGKNSGSGSSYKTVYSYLSTKNRTQLLTNKILGTMKKKIRLDLGSKGVKQYVYLQ